MRTSLFAFCFLSLAPFAAQANDHSFLPATLYELPVVAQTGAEQILVKKEGDSELARAQRRDRANNFCRIQFPQASAAFAVFITTAELPQLQQRFPAVDPLTWDDDHFLEAKDHYAVDPEGNLVAPLRFDQIVCRVTGEQR